MSNALTNLQRTDTIYKSTYLYFLVYKTEIQKHAQMNLITPKYRHISKIRIQVLQDREIYKLENSFLLIKHT
jgi:hypothetical protein